MPTCLTQYMNAVQINMVINSPDINVSEIAEYDAPTPPEHQT